MPTPSGMPKVGESIWLKWDARNPTWLEVIVTRREGTARDYTIWVKRADGRLWFDNRQEKLVTEVPWWVQQGTVRMVKPNG